MIIKPAKTGYYLAVFLALIVAAVLINTAVAQGRPVSDDEVNAIAHELYCPICESTPLDVCATQACADWREIIRTKLSQGETEEQIKDYFVTQYGPRALAEPPREGFTLAVWVIPIVAVVIGGFFFARYLQRIQTAAPSPVLTPESPKVAPKPESDKGDYAARIERELEERRK